MLIHNKLYDSYKLYYCLQRLISFPATKSLKALTERTHICKNYRLTLTKSSPKLLAKADNPKALRKQVRQKLFENSPKAGALWGASSREKKYPKLSGQGSRPPKIKQNLPKKVAPNHPGKG